MKTHVVDKTGKRLALGKLLGRGGEGAVFEIRDNPQTVAKLYHNHLEPSKAEKLSVMVGLSQPEMLKFAAWPQALLYDPTGRRTVGIVMPKIGMGKEIHYLYSPSDRSVNFPDKDWRFLIRAACNCAAAFGILHKHGIVIGDVNQGNVFVSPQATVSLIDCDSFQIQSNGKTYRCLVGVPDFTPPELQTTRFESIDRTLEHDYFGLAILIFHLLFLGRHPFAGRFSGPGDMPIARAIKEYRFAYSSNHVKTLMSPPPHTLLPSELDSQLSALFEQAFSYGTKRPTAETWFNILRKVENNVSKCAYDEGHYFLHSQKCPWCRIVRDGGPNVFVSVAIRQTLQRQATFNLTLVWANIQSVLPPSKALVAHQRQHPSTFQPEPLPEEVKGSYTFRRMVAAAALLGFSLTILGIFWRILYYFGAPILLVFTVWWGVLRLQSPLTREWLRRRKEYRDAETRLHAAKQELTRIIARAMFEYDCELENLKQAKDELAQLDSHRSQELSQLTANVRQHQLTAHLNTRHIRSASIPGVGDARKSMLHSYGIYTAYDVTFDRVSSVPGFGDKLTQEMLMWRAAEEGRFRYDSTKGVPKASLDAIEMKYTQKKGVLIRRLSEGPDALRKITSRNRLAFSSADLKVVRLEEVVAQAECNLNVFG